MKRNIYCSLPLLLGLAFVSAVALAQQNNLPPDTKSPEQRDAATLETLISEAWTNNPEVRLFEAAVTGARGDLITAKTWDNPEVSFAPGAVRTEESGSPSRIGFHGDFGVSQTFRFPGKRALQRAVAEKPIESRQLALSAFRTQLAIQVHRSFYRLLAARQMVALRQRHLRLAQSFLEAARKKVEGGFAPDFEQTKAEVDVASGLKSLREAQADEAVARTALNSLVGRRLDATVTIVGEFSESPSVPEEATLLNHALAQNPSLKIQAAEVERTGLSLALTKKSRLPDFTVGPSVEYREGEQIYGLGISMPLPFWDKKTGAIATATAEQQRALAELDTLRRDIVREVSSAAHLLTAARESLAIYTPAFRGKLKSALDNAAQSYAEGRTSLLVFLEMERTYYDTEAGYYETLQRLYDAQAALEAGLGMPLNELEKIKPPTNVQPEVFGTLFQHSMDDDERHAFGAHFTSPSDIMKIVGPTIVAPWREQVEQAKTLKELYQLTDRLHHFRVLDPACGSGNFLYIAYRELKRVEARIFERLETEFKSEAKQADQMRLSFLSAQNFYGLDILPFAVEIAKVTMMIARKLAIDELHITEQPLPLDNLDKNFIAADALLTSEGSPAPWPKADVIIGNPPFLGAKRLKPERGPDYVNTLRRAYGEVPGMADYCVYWIRKAHDHLPACTAADPVAGRAGLVGTQNIRNNQSRVGGLDYVVKTGTIVEAVENQPWSGEANVHVSIANWVKTQDAALLPKARKLWFKVEPSASAKKLRKRGSGSATKEYELDCRESDFISFALSDSTDMVAACVLSANAEPKVVFTGQNPCHDGFKLEPTQAVALLEKHSDHRDVFFPYMTGLDLVTAGTPTRWVIDFGQRDMLKAMEYPAAFDILKERVMKDVLGKADKEKIATGTDSTRWTRMS